MWALVNGCINGNENNITYFIDHFFCTMSFNIIIQSQELVLRDIGWDITRDMHRSLDANTLIRTFLPTIQDNWVLFNQIRIQMKTINI